MSDGVDFEIIKKTQQILGKYIKKPPLTEKLLSKPPFRFLHDVIMAVMKNTGFLKDLFNQDELIADNVKEREAKLAFLNKLIDAVKNITDIELKVRASKIIAGAQPNETNLLLQAIAHGIDKKLDSSEYVKQNKNEPKKLKKSSSRELKINKSPKEVKSPPEQKNRENRSKIREASKDRKVPSKDNNKDKKEKKTPVSSSRTNKTDIKTKKKEKSTKVKDVDSPESISKTSDNISVKEKYSENGEVENKATPILDQHSNNLESIREYKNEDNATKTASKNDDERPRTRDIQSGYLAKMANNKLENGENHDVPAGKNDTLEIASDMLVIEPEKHVTTPVIRQISARPKSARPKSGEFKEKNEKYHENQKKKMEQPAVTENIVLHTNSLQRPKSSLRPPSVRPSSARPGAPRLRPDSALPIQEVVPMGKINVIVENFDNDADDDETVVIHNAPEDSATVEPIVDLPAKNQSHLVEQILDQIKDNEDLPKSKVDSEWEQDNLRGRDTTSKEMNQLRNLIQSFTKTANPLGKLLNYLHEDIETMHAELQQWTRIKAQLFSEIAKQEKLKLEMEKPLLEKLENLKQDIVKQEHEIIDVRANIIKNDFRIKELINK